MDLEQRFNVLINRDEPKTRAQLDALYAAAEPVDEDFMLGDWAGHTFGYGHPAEAQLQALRWAGKRFGSREDVDPIVCLDENGARVANPILGSARLRSVVHLGRPTATMVYDSQPIFDHFRRISDRIVMGAMDRKGEKAPGYFYLVRL
jgi:hypothetical protein